MNEITIFVRTQFAVRLFKPVHETSYLLARQNVGLPEGALIQVHESDERIYDHRRQNVLRVTHEDASYYVLSEEIERWEKEHGLPWLQEDAPSN